MQFDYGLAFNTKVPQALIDSFNFAILDAQVSRMVAEH